MMPLNKMRDLLKKYEESKFNVLEHYDKLDPFDQNFVDYIQKLKIIRKGSVRRPEVAKANRVLNDRNTKKLCKQIGLPLN
mgnify:CR=1 FL=1|jgi:hypothetical protein|tara:strand:+ start:957 stop:1196 length:240 start_codon:yes stop_codon:yes gene_type:complete